VVVSVATGTFDARIAELQAQVGSGRLTGSVERDQAYAQVQHEDGSLRHKNGQWKYQETALMGGHEGYLRDLADAVLHGDLEHAMGETMERFDNDSAALTPKDTTILARSGRATVRSRGNVVWEKAPQVPRLSDAELRSIRANVRGTGDTLPGGG
jgi:hypothetical protein